MPSSTSHPSLNPYERAARRAVLDAIEAQGLSYKAVAKRLAAAGMDLDPKSLNNRINRGKFSLAFALQVLSALGVESLPIPRVRKTPAASRTTPVA